MENLKVHTCEKVFPNTRDLMKHMPFNDENFKTHLLSAHVLVERAKIFKCDKCTESFYNNRELVLHKVSHIQETVKNERKTNKLENPHIEKPFKCPHCNVSYAAQSTLDAHSVLHKPYPHICKCGIGYHREVDFKSHIKLVHGTKTEEDILRTNGKIEVQIADKKVIQLLHRSKDTSMKQNDIQEKKSKEINHNRQIFTFKCTRDFEPEV